MQAPVTAARPAEAQYDPAKHDAHELWPVVAWKVPVEHAVHTPADAPEYWPAVHGKHSVDSAAPDAPKAVPAGHPTHAVAPKSVW